ncbi:phage protein NinX family protein, partial [Pseudomonas sp.]|uniref:phage protein NinX family protein n=1 Tax=Pseudomonas sp. TaxID=306 RepID=UPI0028A15DC6
CATWHRYKPSSDWSQGGPLVAQNGKRIGLELRLAEVSASFLQSGMRIGYTASDVLIAACRAIVAAKLGDTVQIPSELA